MEKCRFDTQGYFCKSDQQQRVSEESEEREVQVKGEIIMANNNGNSSGGGSTILVIICIIVILGLFGSCSNNDDEYKKTLNSGMEKYYNGEKMTKEEYNAVNGYLEWEDDQKDKTYNDWNN